MHDNTPRIHAIDSMKALGIMLVIMGHVSHHTLLSGWIYSFHMPLFFFISGCMFPISRQEGFIGRKARSILVPYISFGLLSLIYWSMLESRFRHVAVSADMLRQQCISLLGIPVGGGNDYLFNIVLWFLPCMMVVEILLFLTNRLCRRKWHIALVALAYATLSWGMHSCVGRPVIWHIDAAVSIMPVALLGSTCGARFLQFCSQRHALQDACLLLAAAFVSLLATNTSGTLNLMEGLYPVPYPAYYLTAMAGILLVTVVAKYIRLQALEYIGRNSLIIMCIHEPIKRIVIFVAARMLHMEIDMARTNLLFILLATLITLLACLPFVFVINRYTPFLLGRKQSKAVPWSNLRNLNKKEML